MEQKHPISDLLTTTMEKLHTMVDSNTIIGAPIQAEGVTLIPVSKLSFGLGCGGGDFSTKKQPANNENFSGGSGAGVKLEPVAFLVVKGENVRLLPVSNEPEDVAQRVLEMIPDLADKIIGLIDKQKDKKEQNSDFEFSK